MCFGGGPVYIHQLLNSHTKLCRYIIDSGRGAFVGKSYCALICDTPPLLQPSQHNICRFFCYMELLRMNIKGLI